MRSVRAERIDRRSSAQGSEPHDDPSTNPAAFRHPRCGQRCATTSSIAQDADLILHHGKVVTVDRDFSIRQALAVKGDRLIKVGTERRGLEPRGPQTVLVDLDGKMVLPGLIDSHTHPTDACMTEFDHPIPEMETIADVLAYIQQPAPALWDPDRWVVVRQVFITRLKEQRYPTRAELDRGRPQ